MTTIRSTTLCKFNAFDIYKVDHVLSDYGLSVHIDYRRRGIATEMLTALKSVMKVHRLTVTSMLFTTTGSQKAAVKVGFEEDFSVKFSTIQEQFPCYDFSTAGVESAKLMSLKI